MMNEISHEIDEIRRRWGKRVLILGHHYQRSSVLRHADEIGDSLELARKAASHPEAERIVFCGVRFMAETADVLTGPEQAVFMPETSADCPMARMADAARMQQAWDMLEATGGGWLPVVYVNSTADVKALCGRWGGSACTSSNAARVMKWVFDQGKKVFFLPDEHLGRNTARDLGLPEEAVALYDPGKEHGGLGSEDMSRCRVLVWKGFCIVHIAFTADRIREARRQLPQAKIIVHPEVPMEVVKLADAHGSTAQIIRYVDAAPEGSTLVIGTEVNLIERLAEQWRGRKTVKALWPSVCANMAKTSEQNLLALLREWPASQRIVVPADTAREARAALERMLSL